jgi:L,D-transpeptidase catalytic domain
MPTVKDAVFSMDTFWEPFNKTRSSLGIKHTDRVLVVRIGASTLQFYRKKALVKSYVVSTSKRPPSNIANSLGTPVGLHEIAERIGAGQPPGMVFKSRVPTGRHFSEFAGEPGGQGNMVTSRILWLRGLEPGVNAGGDVDTYKRYVYIHGTHREDGIGKPMSAGCVLMRNSDVVELHDMVRAGDLVWIVK